MVCVLAVAILAIGGGNALGAFAAKPAPASRGLRAQIRRIALREATLARDQHPRLIEFATGSLKKASKVMDPQGVLYPTPTPQQARELKTKVALILMRGRFFPNHSEPPPHHHGRPRHRTPVTVIELLIPLQGEGPTGRSFGDSVPVPLSHLGPVTRLD